MGGEGIETRGGDEVWEAWPQTTRPGPVSPGVWARQGPVSEGLKTRGGGEDWEAWSQTKRRGPVTVSPGVWVHVVFN